MPRRQLETSSGENAYYTEAAVRFSESVDVCKQTYCRYVVASKWETGVDFPKEIS